MERQARRRKTRTARHQVRGEIFVLQPLHRGALFVDWEGRRFKPRPVLFAQRWQRGSDWTVTTRSRARFPLDIFQKSYVKRTTDIHLHDTGASVCESRNSGSADAAKSSGNFFARRNECELSLLCRQKRVRVFLMEQSDRREVPSFIIHARSRRASAYSKQLERNLK